MIHAHKVGLLRSAMAACLGTVAGVHLELWWGQDYRLIPTIGDLFMAAVVSSVLLALFVLVLRVSRWLALASVGGVLVCLGALASYIASLLLPKGIFLFHEPSVSLAGAIAIVAESLGMLLGLTLAWVALGMPRLSSLLGTTNTLQ